MARCESCNEWVDCDKCCDYEKELKDLKEWNRNLVEELDSGDRVSRLLAERDKLRDLLFRSRSVIDELMGDTDLDDDESKEFVLMQEINKVLK